MCSCGELPIGLCPRAGSQPVEALLVRYHVDCQCRALPRFVHQCAHDRARIVSNRRIFVRLHAAENSHDILNVRRRVSRCDAAGDRLDRRARQIGCRPRWCCLRFCFLWQFPHFLAIAWMYREDYGRAGICMLPVVEPDGRVTGQQIIAYTVMLVPVSLLPTVLGVSGKVYFVAAMILGLLFLASSVRAALSKSNQHARQLLLASVFYLPLLFGVMVLNR